jgi:AcrR family transcriptional regulator
VTSAAPHRLTAPERRLDLVTTARRMFTEGSYRGTTTAAIAKAAGVSEPILYRHFASKRDLYLAVLDDVWEHARAAWEACLAGTPDVYAALEEIGRGQDSIHECKIQLSELWVQALGEASEDPELRLHLRRHMHEVHDFVADVIRRGQEQGVLHRDRDADAEAWMFISGGFLGMVGRRVGLLDESEITRIRMARLDWLAS